jgi:hypothetical protein
VGNIILEESSKKGHLTKEKPLEETNLVEPLRVEEIIHNVPPQEVGLMRTWGQIRLLSMI